MRKYIEKFLAFLLDAVLPALYRVEVKGLEKLEQINRDMPIIFAAQHPAMMDSVLLLRILWEKYKPRPVADENMYLIPVLRPFMWFVRAIPVPREQQTRERMHKILGTSAEALKNKDSLLIFPAGHLMRSWKTVLGNLSGLWRLRKEFPEAHVVLVSVHGFWGSIFSTERHCGKTPNLFKVFFKVCFEVLAYVKKHKTCELPKRKIRIEFELASNLSEFPRQGYNDRKKLNSSVEKWFNRSEEFPNTDTVW